MNSGIIGGLLDWVIIALGYDAGLSVDSLRLTSVWCPRTRHTSNCCNAHSCAESTRMAFCLLAGATGRRLVASSRHPSRMGATDMKAKLVASILIVIVGMGLAGAALSTIRAQESQPHYQVFNHREWYLQSLWQVQRQTPDNFILPILYRSIRQLHQELPSSRTQVKTSRQPKLALHRPLAPIPVISKSTPLSFLSHTQ